MARSHHRKKHKEHLRQFKHSHDRAVSPVSGGKTAWVFAIVGGVVGLLIIYFAANANLIWSVTGLLAGGAAGYIIGRKIDHTTGS